MSRVGECYGGGGEGEGGGQGGWEELGNPNIGPAPCGERGSGLGGDIVVITVLRQAGEGGRVGGAGQPQLVLPPHPVSVEGVKVGRARSVCV